MAINPIVVIWLLLFSLSFIFITANSSHRSIRMIQSNAEDGSVDREFIPLTRSKREAEVTETESERRDKICEAQKSFFSDKRKEIKDGGRLEETHMFTNESKFNLALAWAGENDDGTLLVLTTDQEAGKSVSTLWRSTNHGRNWTDWSGTVDHQVFRKDDGLQRNPHNPRKVYLISYEQFLYVTEDGGNTWRKSSLVSVTSSSTSVDEQLEFHPEQQFEDYVATISNDRQLHVTYNNFMTNAKPIKANVQTVKWGTAEAKTEKCLYVTTKQSSKDNIQGSPEMLNLERYNSEKDDWKIILNRVVEFNVENKFMYASIFKSDNPKTQNDERLMMISTDGGDTWGQAQLPTLTGDRFFSVLDMTEGLIFIHVDNPGDTGHGTLFTSSSNGIVYSKSLLNHLFPNFNTIHDFYKVESIRGVYLASQMSEDKSIHTVITYNRGGEWKKVQRPVDVECKNSEKEGCYLQIHNAYSMHRGIKAQLPLSQKDAYGLILVHGHVASNLQTTPPDVYLSSDGGYNFKRVLRGHHAYEIADSGGLLVAVPLETDYPKIVKFSTDEGNCWHIYKFTNDDIKFTGLLTEPGGKSMTVGLWGYHKVTKKWTVSVIDFSTVVTRQCKEQDYVPWTPHTSLKTRLGFEGCLLGKKETFKKIKPEAWCRNGYYKNMEVSTEKCKCTEDDYECDYGFYRPENSVKCVRQPEIRADQIDICKGGHLEKLITVGYRLVPGDICDPVNSFHPVSDVAVLDIICNTGDQLAIEHNIIPPDETNGSSTLVIAAVLIIILVLVAVVGAFFVYKMILLRRHRVVYRYSMLTQAEDRDNELENALTSHDTLYSESSDDEVEQDNRLPKHNGVVVNTKPSVRAYHDDSDEDMLG